MALVTTINMDLIATLTATADFGSPSHRQPINFSDDLATGTAVDCADVVWSDQRTLALSTAESLDLAGSLTNAFGTTLTFVKVKAIYIQNTETRAGAILAVGGAASNAF